MHKEWLSDKSKSLWTISFTDPLIYSYKFLGRLPVSHLDKFLRRLSISCLNQRILCINPGEILHTRSSPYQFCMLLVLLFSHTSTYQWSFNFCIDKTSKYISTFALSTMHSDESCLIRCVLSSQSFAHFMKHLYINIYLYKMFIYYFTNYAEIELRYE